MSNSEADQAAVPDRSFDCTRCTARVSPTEDQWIFYWLCDACFVLFNEQKWRGRNARMDALMLLDLDARTAGQKAESPPWFENSSEWIAAEAATLTAPATVPHKEP